MWHKRKIDNFDPYNVVLAIATNIPVLLKTGFVLQGHKLETWSYLHLFESCWMQTNVVHTCLILLRELVILSVMLW